MKKRLISLALLLILILVPALTAQAAEGVYIYDTVGILTADEQNALQQKAAEISEQYECAVYVVVVDDFQKYTNYSVRQAAENIYTDNGFGWGEEKSGVMLLLSMAERDYSLIAYGYGNTAFTDYGKDILSEKFLDDFKGDNWYAGFDDYVGYSGEMLQRSREGSPIDVSSDGVRGASRSLREKLGPIGLFLIIIVLPVAIAFIVCSTMKAKMKSVRRAVSAQQYNVDSAVDLYESSDVFTHVTESRVRIQNDSSRSGGGHGGTTVSSSGFSGKSGKF